MAITLIKVNNIYPSAPLGQQEQQELSYQHIVQPELIEQEDFADQQAHIDPQAFVGLVLSDLSMQRFLLLF